MIPNNEQQKPMVENISCILPANDQLGGLFLGNVYGAQNSEILKEYGIRAVITASAQTKISYKFQDVPFHLKIEAHDKDDYYISEHINECIHFIEQHRKFTNVFVHCYAGVSRSSAIVCAYMMWKYRWNLQKTFNFVVFKRIVAKPNPGFYNQLKQVEIKLKIGTENKPTIVRNSQETIVKQQTPSFYQQPEHIQPRNQWSMYQKPQLPVIANHNGVSNLHNRVSCQFKNSPPSQIYKTYNREELKQEPVSNTSRIVQGRQSVYEKNSSTVQNLNHSGVPIPKILNRRSEKVVKGDEIQKRNSFNYYLSPQLQPASPRNQLPLKSNSKMTTTGNSFYGSSLRNGSNVSNSEVFVQSSIYSTNYKTKGGYQNHQKAKSTSRCLIRPKDLPGYKNY